MNTVLDMLRQAIMLGGATSAALLSAHIVIMFVIVIVTMSTMIMLYAFTH